MYYQMSPPLASDTWSSIVPVKLWSMSGAEVLVDPVVYGATWGVTSSLLSAVPGSCGVSAFVTMTDAEYNELVSNSPFSFSAADGMLIGAAVLGVWMIGFAARAVIRTLGADHHSGEESV
jgi:hypothetical protein